LLLQLTTGPGWASVTMTKSFASFVSGLSFLTRVIFIGQLFDFAKSALLL
jgi:hypothetical protein